MRVLDIVCYLVIFTMGIESTTPPPMTAATYYSAEVGDLTDSVWLEVTSKLLSCLLVKFFSYKEQSEYIHHCQSSYIKHCTTHPYQMEIIPH